MGSEQLLAPSASFKKEAAKSISAILFFMLVYLLLMAFSIALLVGSFYAGIGLFHMKPGIYTILGGFGIVAVGVMVFVFLVKFLFSSNK